MYSTHSSHLNDLTYIYNKQKSWIDFRKASDSILHEWLCHTGLQRGGRGQK